MSYILKETVVIGAGISGLAVAKWLKVYKYILFNDGCFKIINLTKNIKIKIKEYKIDFVVIEKSDDIAGLWRYRDDDYGVMKFTHINVSKYNYCYSDHPFPKETNEYPNHTG